jgi:hypothetical protein
MCLRIEKKSEGQKVVVRLSGRIRSQELLGLKKLLDGITQGKIIDMKDVTLVDVEAVRFLSLCEDAGLELRNCPPYIREWILREGRTE